MLLLQIPNFFEQLSGLFVSHESHHHHETTFGFKEKENLSNRRFEVAH